MIQNQMILWDILGVMWETQCHKPTISGCFFFGTTHKNCDLGDGFCHRQIHIMHIQLGYGTLDEF